MSPIVSPARQREHLPRPQLRLLCEHDEPHAHDAAATGPHLPGPRAVGDEPTAGPPVLLVGADARRRASLRAELAGTLPERTSFAEAHAVFEVLERAPASRLMVLAGDLDDTSAGSLMRIVGERYPQLPVISVGA